MVTVGAVVAADTFPSTPSPSLTHTLISLQVWTCLEQEQGLGFHPMGCAQLPTDWPERGWLGLGTIPTDTASWACLALRGMLTPGGLVSCILGCLVPARPRTWWAQGSDSPAQPATGNAKEHPQPVPSSPPLPPSPHLLEASGSKSSWAKRSLRAGWGFGVRANLPCHPQEEMSVRTRASGAGRRVHRPVLGKSKCSRGIGGLRTGSR